MIVFLSRMESFLVICIAWLFRMGENRFCTFDAFPIYAEAYCIVCAGIKMNLKSGHKNVLGKKHIIFIREVQLVFI